MSNEATTDNICGGPLDVLLILRDHNTGLYSPAYFREAAFPGVPQPTNEVSLVRLRAVMHHTTGFESLEEAQSEFDALVTKVCVPEENRWRDEPVDSEITLGMCLLLPNWKRPGAPDGPWNGSTRKLL